MIQSFDITQPLLLIKVNTRLRNPEQLFFLIVKLRRIHEKIKNVSKDLHNYYSML